LRILISNDDGYLARGLRTLAETLAEFASVTVVAPDRNRSGASNSLTLDSPLRVEQVSDGVYFVNGTPTDCVHVAITGLLEDEPDMVVSGINHGANLGDDVLYSGTVAAAMEATILGIPAVAVSYAGKDFARLGKWTDLLTRLLRQLLLRDDYPDQTLFNVNLPGIEPEDVSGVRITTLGRRAYVGSLTRARDPAGREYFWIGGGESTWWGSDNSDFRAVHDGYISITPLHLDLTNHKLLEGVAGWGLKL
jgi:5'-nucleotidase